MSLLKYIEVTETKKS